MAVNENDEGTMQIPVKFRIIKAMTLQDLMENINIGIHQGWMPMGAFVVLPEMVDAPKLQTGPQAPQPQVVPCYYQSMFFPGEFPDEADGKRS